jgi:hypothetical protein
MNKGPDHLLRLKHGEEPTSLEDTLSDAQILDIRNIDDHFADIVQFLSTRMAPSDNSPEEISSGAHYRLFTDSCSIIQDGTR